MPRPSLESEAVLDDDRREARARADATLINTVREHRILWDRNHSFFHQTQPTTLAWGDVLNVLDTKLGQKVLFEAGLFDEETGNLCVEALRRRWQNLKASYKSYQRKTAKGRDVKPWRWYRFLRFIDGDETPADAEECAYVQLFTKSDKDELDNNNEEKSCTRPNNDNDNDNNDDQDDQDREDDQDEEPRRAKRERWMSPQEAEESHVQRIQNCNGDKSRMFGHVVELYLRDMREEDQWEAQLEILSVLKKWQGKSKQGP